MVELTKPTLYNWKNSPRGFLPLWAADASGMEIDFCPLDVETMKSEEFTKVHPQGRCPALLTDSGVVLECTTIARYIARSSGKLYGADSFEQAQVDQWLDFFQEDLSPLLPLFAYQPIGLLKAEVLHCKQTMSDSLNMFKTKLEALNKAIEKKDYFVGGQLSLADLAIFAGLYWPFSFATSDKDRKPYPHLLKWYTKMGAEQWFVARHGRLRLCPKPFPIQQLPGDDAPKDAKKKAQHKEKGEEKKAAGKAAEKK